MKNYLIYFNSSQKNTYQEHTEENKWRKINSGKPSVSASFRPSFTYCVTVASSHDGIPALSCWAPAEESSRKLMVCIDPIMQRPKRWQETPFWYLCCWFLTNNLVSTLFTNLLQFFTNLLTAFSPWLTLANVYLELYQRFGYWHCGSVCRAKLQCIGKYP